MSKGGPSHPASRLLSAASSAEDPISRCIAGLRKTISPEAPKRKIGVCAFSSSFSIPMSAPPCLAREMRVFFPDCHCTLRAVGEEEDDVGLRTPLYDWHVRRGAKIVDFGGWDMPVLYSSITAEHAAARSAAGLFDISHMGRIRFNGPGAEQLLEFLLTNRVSDLAIGQVRYALMLNDDGCVLDDVLLYRLPSGYLLVVNASNRAKLIPWINRHLPNYEASIDDTTTNTAMIAVQGPRAIDLARPLLADDPGSLRYYYAMETYYEGVRAVVSRTGYTGEDGVEIIVPSADAVGLWEKLLSAGAAVGAAPIGLGARDTLRLEAGMPLYGHELTESIDPIQAGLGWAVKDKEFVGREAISRRDPRRAVRVGLQLSDKRIAREGFPILAGGAQIGVVCSGTFGPTVGASIAMGYITPDHAKVGSAVEVSIRQASAPATVVSLPFYKRKK
jgi:aminomethyltransferase